MSKTTEEPALSPTAEIARRHRTQLPEGWELHFADEASALAAYDSSAPASVPGMSKLEADGPSIHAMQGGVVGARTHPDGGNAPGQEAYAKAVGAKTVAEAVANPSDESTDK